jgi:SseB protein C-terminal domain
MSLRAWSYQVYWAKKSMKNHAIEVDIPTGTRMRLGVPAELPTIAIAALVELFSGMDNVVRARLGLMEKVSQEGVGAFSYTIGFECLDNKERTEEEVLHVLQQIPMGRWPIAIVPPNLLTAEAIVFYTRSEKKTSSNLNWTKWPHWLSRLFRR